MIGTLPARRIVLAVACALAMGGASAAVPCGVLLASYLESHEGEVRPCLVDLQENGMCFRVPGMTLESVTRTLDGHLQEQGVPRPDWTTTSGGNGALVSAPGGDRLEIVIAADGPFATTGTCRIVPER